MVAKGMLTVEITSYGIQIKVYSEGSVAYPGYTLSILKSIYVFALGLDEDLQFQFVTHLYLAGRPTDVLTLYCTIRYHNAVFNACYKAVEKLCYMLGLLRNHTTVCQQW